MTFEDRLRRSLHAQADDVTPDPALFATVQSRIRRGRTFRFALAGVTAALAITGVALAAPALIDRRIEFEPGPVATQPAPDPTDTSAGGGFAAELVFTDDADVYLLSGDAEPEHLFGIDCPENATCDYEPVRSVAARPQAPGADVTAVSASTCSGLEHSGGTDRFMADTCPVSVAFSPDGGHLAWIGQAGPDGDWMLHTVDWTDDGPGEGEASFGLPWGVETVVDIQDWVWESQTADRATGYMVFRTVTDGVTMLLRLPVERQPDGALAVTGNPGPVPSFDSLTPLAFAAAGTDTTYTLSADLAPDGPTHGEVSWVLDGEPAGGFAVPDELFGGQRFDPVDLWLTASPEVVVFGNSRTGRAWWILFPGGSGDGPAPSPQVLGELIRDADLVTPADVPAEQPRRQSQVDVYFGMTGAEECVADQVVQRRVEGPGVARAALNELLAGPTPQESNAGIVSPFGADTADALIDVTISDGEARVDFRDFSDDVEDDACTKGAIVDALSSTLLQFPTVESTLYSFDGDTAAFEEWLGGGGGFSSAPLAVAETAEQIRAAAQAEDWDALRDLQRETSCTLSDEKEPCVPYWRDQQERGEDPLGTMVDLLSEPPTKNPDAPIWVWPAEWADPDSDYSGPRIGIDEDGVWRYFVQEGG